MFSRPINSTAGAVPVKNEKGEISMQKVKVTRYISGKRPEYAGRPSCSDEEEPDIQDYISKQHEKDESSDVEDEEDDYLREDIVELERADPRLRRLMSATASRSLAEPKVMTVNEDQNCYRKRHHESVVESEEEEEEVELGEGEIQIKRALLRRKVLERGPKEDLLAKEDEESESDEIESEEEVTDSEEDDICPRLKPIFVKKEDRLTIKDRNNKDDKADEAAASEFGNTRTNSKREERRRETLKIVEEAICRDRKKSDDYPDATMPKLTDVDTDEDNGDAEYEAWKIRELKRLRRDRDERNQHAIQQAELEKLRNMNEEEQRLERRRRGRVVVNQAKKGKYKFMQKYYHRGVFYLDKEDAVYQQDFSQPTLEDHVDKTTLPAVMQVKNFGRSGRTKYTHLTDQDTTNFEAGWLSESAQKNNFHTTQAAGIRQVFEKPKLKRISRN